MSTHDIRFCNYCKRTEKDLGQELWGCGNCVDFYKNKLKHGNWEKKITYYCGKTC